MRIDHILQQKGSEVATIGSDRSVADAADELARLGVGTLVVSDDERHIVGILSERDLTRALARHGAAVLGLAVADLMTPDVHTCVPEDSVDELAAAMTERRIRHVPVLVDDELAGIVSIGDVVKNRLDELEAEAQTLHDYIEAGR
ncbi:MAG: CBS domain-containing protein [Acidimicrobiia bacterium]|nr:CBS domain-containing protein [Acidimicrobiia bacterium]